MGDQQFSNRLRSVWLTSLDCLVQAAIGPVALDVAREIHSEEYASYGMSVLVVAVLAILITAPVGATFITLLGPRLLDKEPTATPESNTAPSIQNNGRGGSSAQWGSLKRCYDLAAWWLQKSRGLHYKTKRQATHKSLNLLSCCSVLNKQQQHARAETYALSF